MDKNIRVFASCHNHSYFSDGDYSPEMMVKLSYNMGHGGFILTDHDTVKGTYFAHKEAKRWGLKTVLGCEFSTFHKGVGVHLLGFDFNVALADETYPIDVSLLDYISEINAELDITVPAEEIIPENFNSASALVALLTRLDEA